MTGIPDSVIARAVAAARASQSNAYAPYSNWHVGAAIITSDETIFAACNVENESDDLRVCAERNAIAAAVAAGKRDIQAVVVVSPDQRFWPPCTSCRGVITEFAPDAEIILNNKFGDLHRARLEVLPTFPFEEDGTGEEVGEKQ